MTISRDNARLTLENDVDGDGNTDTGVFEFTTDVTVKKEIRPSFLLDNSLDRILGGLNEILGADQSVKRSGITIDTGGGDSIHEINFVEADGSTGHQWGDGTGDEVTDATGDSARRKADVLERYIKTGTYDSKGPAHLEFGEYNSVAGVYEDSIPVAIDQFQVTVSAEDDKKIEGRIRLKEVGTLSGQDTDDSAVGRKFF